MVDYYIAGPMRGLPENNFPMFFDVEEKLSQLGYTSLNPARMDEEILGLTARYALPTTAALRDFMIRDLPAMLKECNNVVLLPGWQNSRGACVEAYVGYMCGLGIDFWNSNINEPQMLPFEDFLPALTRMLILEMMREVF